MKEIWKDISGWENKYQVSNLGRVRRVSHYSSVKGQQDRFYQQKICIKKINRHGYEIVQLWEKGKNSNKQVHRVMAEAFIPNPKNLEQVNHKNGIKHDNRLENLEWISRRGNALHAVYELKKCGIPCKPILCLETGKKYLSIHSAARDIGTTAICISRVLHGKRKQIHGLHWIFL